LFLLLTLYWDKRVVRIDFWTDLVLRRKGRCSSFWPCTEMRGSFLLMTLYWDERVMRIDFWTDLVLRWEGRCSSFWPCTETRGRCYSLWPCTDMRGSRGLIFEQTLYWDERVVVLHFDLVLRREGCEFWIELTLYWDEKVVILHFDLVLRPEGYKLWINLRTMLLRLYNRVVEYRDTTSSPYSNNIFCWFAWSLTLPCCKMYVGCMTMHEFFLFCSLLRMHLWMHEIWFFCFNMNFDFVLFEKKMQIWMHEIWFFFVLIWILFLFFFEKMHVWMHEIWFFLF